MKGLKRKLRERRLSEKRTASFVVSEKREQRRVSKKPKSSFSESFKSRMFREEKTSYGVLYNKFIDNLIKFLQSTKQDESSLEHAEDLAYYLNGENHKGSIVYLISQFSDLLLEWENPALRPSAERDMKNFIARV